MKLSERIDKTRECWASELETCRNELLDTIGLKNPLARLVVELDYLLVEGHDQTTKVNSYFLAFVFSMIVILYSTKIIKRKK